MRVCVCSQRSRCFLPGSGVDLRGRWGDLGAAGSFGRRSERSSTPSVAWRSAVAMVTAASSAIFGLDPAPALGGRPAVGPASERRTCLGRLASQKWRRRVSRGAPTRAAEELLAGQRAPFAL